MLLSRLSIPAQDKYKYLLRPAVSWFRKKKMPGVHGGDRHSREHLARISQKVFLLYQIFMAYAAAVGSS
jgi:hypothetical protein